MIARALQPGNPEMVKYDLELEASDPLALHEITVQFAAFRANTPSQVLPRAVYFTFQFYTLPPTRTERTTSLESPEESKVDRGVEAPNDASRLLVRETGSRRSRMSLPSSSSLRWTVILVHLMRPSFCGILSDESPHVDVWDADSRLHVGTSAIPLDRLLRQRAPVAKVAAEYLLWLLHGLVDEGLYGASSAGSDVQVASAGNAGSVVGHVQVVCCNYGEESSLNREESKENEEPNTSRDWLDWRRGRLRT